MLGGEGKDNVIGGSERRLGTGAGLKGGDKNIAGGPGNDVVIGGRGSDKVLGDAGNDWIWDGPTREFSLDRLSGGDGNDVFLVENVPAVKDIVTCDGGFDRVLADTEDVVAPDCERVVIVHGSLEEVIQQRDEFFASIPASFWEGLPPIPEG